MNLRSGHPFWLVKNGIGNSFPHLQEDLDAEVVIVGGGITGALLAYHFAKANLATVLLDKREIGWGSTAASTALLQYEIDEPLHKLRETYGKEFADRAYRSCADAIRKIETLVGELDDDCDFQRKPSLFLAQKEGDVEELRAEFNARVDAGFEVEWLDREELLSATGMDRPAAIRSRCGAQVDAYRLTRAAMRAASDCGVQVYDRTDVLDCRFSPGGAEVVTDRGYNVRCRHVVYATGYEVGKFLERDVVNLNSSFAIVTEPLEGDWPAWSEDALIWEMAEPYLYIRSTSDKRLIIGGEDESFKNATARDAVLGTKSEILLKKFRKLAPHVITETAFSWAGTFGETEDGLAYIGSVPERPRSYFALGFGGNGITYSILAAEILRDALLGKVHEYADLYTFDRNEK